MYRAIILLAALIGGCVSCAHSQQKSPVIQLIGEGKSRAIQAEATWIHSLDSANSKESDDLQKRLQVKVASQSKPSDPAILGKVSLEKGKLVFRPRFPFREGVKLKVFLQDADGKQTLLQKEILIPDKVSLPTSITQVYPTTDQLPENLLKFYITFSSPMSRGEIYRYVSIRDADGKPVELPFLEIEQELWSPDGLRVTLLLDPGRIKRGLKPRMEMGPILKAGESYEFVISGKWLSANGKPLGKSFVKKFQAGKYDEMQPDPAKWKFSNPQKMTRNALEIQLDEPLDFGMLQRVIEIRDAAGKRVAGKVSVSRNESVWNFVPEENWQAGRYRIEIDKRLEDLCGNSIEKTFDVDVFDKSEPTRKTTTSIPFEIK